MRCLGNTAILAFGLTIVLLLINLPIIVWMLDTHFRETPGAIRDAARMDGTSPKGETLYVPTPTAVPEIASTILVNIVPAWNNAWVQAPASATTVPCAPTERPASGTATAFISHAALTTTAGSNTGGGRSHEAS